jgi:predicted SAM-dependent methyltransferase
MRRLNIGCGTEVREGWVNIDNRPWEGVNMVRDVTRGLPFDSDSVDEIYTSHMLEHLNPTDAQFFLKECQRVLKRGGTLEIHVPHGRGRDAFALDHRSFYTEETFLLLNDKYQGNYQFLIQSMRREEYRDELVVNLMKKV